MPIIEPATVERADIGKLAEFEMAYRTASCAELAAANTDTTADFVFEVAADEATLIVNALILLLPVNPWLAIIGHH